MSEDTQDVPMSWIEALLPEDTPIYMMPAWLGCMSWAIGTPEIVDTFRQETGFAWRPGHSGLEQMIDESTGVQKQFCEAFIRWANVNIWGPMDGSGDEPK